MQFLKTLLWVVIAVFVFYLGSRNWFDVTLNLWGDIQVDIKAPVLLGLVFLLGWLPTWLIHRTRMWRLRTRLQNYERQQPASAPASPFEPAHEPTPEA